MKIRGLYCGSGGGHSGSALLLTLMAVSLLLVLVLGFVTFVRIELRTVSSHQQQMLARTNARLGLELALARLQETAGPDMRVTATASLLDQDPDTSAPDGVVHPHWTGVWRKQNPDSRIHTPRFEGWLTSLASGQPDQLVSSQQALDPTRSIQMLGKGSVMLPGDSVWAEKVDIPASGAVGNSEGRYAYLVLDEGVKASLVLQDPDQGQAGTPGYWSQVLAQRQSPETMPGFSVERNGGAVIREFTQWVSRLPGYTSLSLMDPDFGDGRRMQFHDATLRTMGVESNTARGGLKTDLTLAFEMPDNQFHSLSAFTDSGEENRSGSWNQGFDLGYIYALESRSAGDTRPQSETNPAAANWASSQLKIRGPSWERLRNFYRLYLERRALGPTAGLTARAPGPNRFDGVRREGAPVLSYASTKQADSRNLNEFSGLYVFGSLNQSGDVIRVTESALAPVVTRVMYVFSLAREDGNLALVMNNIVVLHNPYDVPIEFRGFKFSPSGLPIERLRIRRRPDPTDPAPALGDLDKDITSENDWLRFLNGASNPWTYVNYIFTKDGTDSPSGRMVMEPGELIAFSNTDKPLQYGSATVGKVGLASGPMYEEDSGLYFAKFGQGTTNPAHDPQNYVQSIALDDDSRIWVEIELAASWGNYLFITPDDLNASSNSWERSHSSDALLGLLQLPIGTLTGGGRTLGSLTGDYITGAELGTSLDDRVPLFVMDARLKPLTDDAAVLTSFNQRAMVSQDRFLNGDSDQWEARLYEINSFNEIDLDLDVFSGRNNAYWGPSVTAGSGLTKFPLFQIPRGAMMSIADFAHMEMGHFVHDPPYAVGNSFAHPLIDRDAVYNFLGTGNQSFSVVDQSFLSNEALWDGYFFSTLRPREDLGWSFDQTVEGFRSGEEPLPNRNFLFFPMSGVEGTQVDQDLLDPERISAHFLNQGVFNVNSTSVPAWTAVLSGLHQREITLSDGSTQTVQGSFYSRLDYPLAGSTDRYTGFLDITDEEVGNLATEIVREVKTRGPFLSLADFVNRRLAHDETGLSGPLQAAIERAGINDRFSNTPPSNSTFVHPEHQAKRTGAGAPGYLLQSDILRLLGARMTPRSDTFLIRAYGEAFSGNSTSSATGAWCEALVQRVPEPVQALSPLENGTDPGNYEPLNPESFGRRFKILSFRYLRSDEI